MKKMYLAIFLIILVVFVFAGCLNFSDTLGSSFSDIEETGDAYEPDTTTVYVPGNQNGVEYPSVQYPSDITEDPSSSENNTQVNEEQPSSDTGVSAPASSEYDILKSGNFYMTGSMIDSSGTKAPMEIAITDGSIYMLSDFSGTPMGMLIKDKCVYMVYPEKKAYLELSDSIMNMAGLDIDELLDSDTINFASYGNLGEAASVTQEACNGRNCTVYHFNVSTGESRVYMDGTELVRLASYDGSGKFLTSTDIDAISGTVPADKSAPPASYKAYKGVTGMFSFMTLLEDVME